MTVLRLAALAVLALAVMLGLALTAGTSAHPGHPEKRIWDGRWYQEVAGGDYDAWMTLRTSDVWVNCDVSEAICGSRWYDPFDGAITDWNTQATTVDFQYFEDDQDPNYDVNVYVEDVVLGMPDLLGIALSFDINGDPCDDACTFHYFDVIAGDDAHTGEYATPAERQGTIVHELGHAINLMHESSTIDSSQHFECGLDEFGGTIPHSVMAYDCIDPVSIGGAGETYVQEWDVCGVNHAYFDPGIGYAGCGVVESPTPTPPPGGGLAGDVDCSGSVNSVDALKTLRYVAGLPVQQNELCTDIGGGIAGFAARGARDDRDGATFATDDVFPDRQLGSPASPGLGPQVVIGSDERVQVTDTTPYPLRAIAQLELFDQLAQLMGACTGTFIGPDTLLTAAHCLYDPVTGWTYDVAVIPGKNGGSEPYGYEFASNFWVPDGWINTGGSALYDWGVIKMPSSSLGGTVGWFAVANLTTSTLSRSDFMPAIVGYPGDKPSGTMWAGSKPQFLSVGAFNLTYDVDTAAGQSGSAIFSLNTGEWFLGYIVGVHTQGGITTNTGSRIDGDLLSDVLLACSVMNCTIEAYTEQAPSVTPTPPHTPTTTPSKTPTPTPSKTPTPTPTSTSVSTPTLTPTPIPTATPEPTGGQHFQGDVDCNGSVNAVDALKILRYVAGLSNNLPNGCPAIGT